MTLEYSTSREPSKAKIALQEKLSSTGLAQFIAPMRVKPGTRGDLLTILRKILSMPTCPPIVEWRDLYRVLARRNASHETIIEARILWAQYKSSIATVSPVITTRGISP